MVNSDAVSIIDNESLPGEEEEDKPSLPKNRERSRLILGVGLAFLSSFLFTVCGLILKQITINVSDILGRSQNYQTPEVSRGFKIADLVRVRLVDSFEVNKYWTSDEIFPANTHGVLDITGSLEIFPHQRRLHHPGGCELHLAAAGHEAAVAAGNSERSLCPLGVHVCLQHAAR